MEGRVTYDNDDLNLKATELRLGLPGTDETEDHEQAVSTARNNKRPSPDDCVIKSKSDEAAPVAK